MGMHNKGTYTRVFTYAYTRIDIRVYAKYERIIRVCVVRIYLSCTVCQMAFFVFAKVGNGGAKAGFRIMLTYFEINESFMCSNLFCYYRLVCHFYVLTAF